MEGADMLIYLLYPVSTPSSLPTRGSAIPSVSIHLADHHLTQLPAQSTRSSVAGQHHPGTVSRNMLHDLELRWISSIRTGIGSISAKPSPESLRVCQRPACRADRFPGLTTPFRAPDTSLGWARLRSKYAAWFDQSVP
ncbi:hypothetical protein ACSBR2_002923 [Camellia fascicularis]